MLAVVSAGEAVMGSIGIICATVVAVVLIIKM